MKSLKQMGFGLAVLLAGVFAAGGAAQATAMHHGHHHAKPAPKVHHHHHAAKPAPKAHHHHHHHAAPKPVVLVTPGKPCKCGTFKYYSRKHHGCLDARNKK
jgi:hypothetical protein